MGELPALECGEVYTCFFIMSDKPDKPDKPAEPGADPAREYEKSGLYPANGKPFRLWRLLGFLVLVMAAIAAASALLNVWLLPAA
jgi:hypothetical protein